MFTCPPPILTWLAPKYQSRLSPFACLVFEMEFPWFIVVYLLPILAPLLIMPRYPRFIGRARPVLALLSPRPFMDQAQVIKYWLRGPATPVLPVDY